MLRGCRTSELGGSELEMMYDSGVLRVLRIVGCRGRTDTCMGSESESIESRVATRESRIESRAASSRA
eukprot:6331970-Alexandrium_andersonii.AAC.1